MAESVGQIGLDLVVNQNGFNKQMQGITGLAKKAGAALAAAFAVKKIVEFGKECLKLGSDLSEVQNVVDVTFTKMNSKVNEFAKNAASSFGLSETMAKRYVGTFGAMAKAFGFSEKAAYDMGTTLTGLAGDVASFYNLSQDEAYTKLKSVFTGETESLKDLGVVMTQAALDQYAMANGFGKTTAKMSESEKVMLRYQFVTSQLALAQGDFARTSDSWANQTRLLSLQFDSLKASIGQGLINALTPAIKFLNLLLSKLQVVADAFSNFTAKIFGKKVTASAQAVNNSVAGIGDTASSAVSGVGNAANETAKAAKKASKAVMSFDGLNTLDTGKDDGGSSGKSGGGSGGGAGGGGISDVDGSAVSGIADATEEASGRITKAIDAIVKKFKFLAGLFKEGFKLGLGDLNFDAIQKNLKNIGSNLMDIFTDPKVLSAADSYVNTTAKTLGKLAGSGASIGLTLAELVTGSISKYLDQNNKFIKDKLINIFKIGERGQEIVGDFAVTIADIFSVFRSPEAQQIGADLIAIFSNSFLSVTELVGKFGTDLIDFITKPIIENKDKVKEAIKGTLDAAKEYIGGAKDFINGVFESINNTYDKYIKPAFDNFKEGASKVFGAFYDAYNEYIAPTVQKVGAKMRELINDYINPMVQKVTDLAGKIIEDVSEIWNKTLAPFIAWLIDKIAPKIAKFFSDISETGIGLWKTISKVVGDLTKVIGGIADFLTGVFTGNWKKAWQGIKDIFSGIISAIKDILSPIGQFFKEKWDGAVAKTKAAFNGIKEWFKDRYNDITGVFKSIGSWFGDRFDEAYSGITKAFKGVGSFFSGLGDDIKGSFKGAINGVISLLNRLIGWMNDKLSFSWPAFKIAGKTVWDGGNVTLAHIPTITPLATGGYVKANTPQLAMIGDNRHEGEIVAPESKLRQMAMDVAKQSGSGSSLEVIRLLKEILAYLKSHAGDTILYLDNKEVARAANKGNDRLQTRYKTVKATP